MTSSWKGIEFSNGDGEYLYVHYNFIRKRHKCGSFATDHSHTTQNERSSSNPRREPSLAEVSDGLARFAKFGAELAQTSSEKVHHWEMALDAMQAAETVAEGRYEKDTESLKAVLRAKASRFEAELELVRVRDVAKRDRASAGGE